MQIIGLIGNFFGGDFGGSGLTGGGMKYAGGGPKKLFASGGYVDGPTPALVGEGGQGEYIIPSSEMSNSMARWNAGASGAAVIDGADPATAEGNAFTMGDVPITISTGPVMQFEGSNYVSQEEFAKGIKVAAKQGEAAAIRKLQMSASTRRKLGMQ